MKFQIKKLIVWRKGETGEKREIKFLTDKVNIITGASQTGKSAIIHIIDYCLGSTHCPVPAGVVRENVSWYGLLINCQEKNYLLARRNPMTTATRGATIITSPNVTMMMCLNTLRRHIRRRTPVIF